MSIKVLIVDDSRFFRDRITEILSLNSSIKVIGTATNGQEAVAKAQELKPDVITMDYEMPTMDGITAVREIMSKQPTPILMFSSLSYEGARTTLDALAAGAVDFLPKNFESVSKDKGKANQLLIDRVIEIAKPIQQTQVSNNPAVQDKSSNQVPCNKNDEQPTPQTIGVIRKSVSDQSQVNSHIFTPVSSGQANHSYRKKEKPYKIVAIGASTGGPIAVQNILSQLPSSFPVPIVLVQHMPASFTKAYADRLDQICNVHIQEAEDGMILKPSHVYVAPGGKQLMITSQGGYHIRIVEGDQRLNYKPSVDLTFASLAKHFSGDTLALVMTGMGSDGCDGARLLHQEGSSIWIQDQDSCVVFGMPAAVMRSGNYHEIVALDQIGDRLIAEVCR